MPKQEVLIMAMTHMLSGVCTAGFSRQPHPQSHLAWVRPVKEHGTLLLGDLTDSQGRVIQCGDVIEFPLHAHRPRPPHSEDWTCDFIYRRPRLLRNLEGDRRARFLAEHLDKAPQEILGPAPTRSLCLIKPDQLWANFSRDDYSLKYQARIGFIIDGIPCHPALAPRGIPVTDIKWRALGKSWFGIQGGEIKLDQNELSERLDVDDFYLAIGLSRSYQGQIWTLVVGVHTVPNYRAKIDYQDI